MRTTRDYSELRLQTHQPPPPSLAFGRDSDRKGSGKAFIVGKKVLR